MAVPIRHHLGDERAFGPDELDAMGKAFAAALAKLGLHDLKDPLTETVGAPDYPGGASWRTQSN